MMQNGEEDEVEKAKRAYGYPTRSYKDPTRVRWMPKMPPKPDWGAVMERRWPWLLPLVFPVSTFVAMVMSGEGMVLGFIWTFIALILAVPWWDYLMVALYTPFWLVKKMVTWNETEA